ncbi:unnamed protein product [Ambrosiozyma monospora]|uniref:Unnamed protein product n=1 Tax=Ambrosiozyma monospora TaxID=43982 RepID=A0ACB5TGX5_AMBMO|nr:unnamed protein product [Ambrosiozyma monospora]
MNGSTTDVISQTTETKVKTPLNQNFPLARDLTISKSKRKAKKDAEAKAAAIKANSDMPDVPKNSNSGNGSGSGVGAAIGGAIGAASALGISSSSGAFGSSASPSPAPVSRKVSVPASTSSKSSNGTAGSKNLRLQTSAPGVTASTTGANGFQVKSFQSPLSSPITSANGNPTFGNNSNSNGGGSMKKIIQSSASGNAQRALSPILTQQRSNSLLKATNGGRSPSSPIPDAGAFNNNGNGNGRSNMDMTNTSIASIVKHQQDAGVVRLGSNAGEAYNGSESPKMKVSVRQNGLYQNFNKQKQELSNSSSSNLKPGVAGGETSNQVFDLTPEHDPMTEANEEEDAIDASALFVTATYPFDASSLESEMMLLFVCLFLKVISHSLILWMNPVGVR